MTRWEVVIIGDTARDYEVAVVKTTNEHGKRSFGWGGPEKYIVASASGEYTPQWLRDEYLKLAQRLADSLTGFKYMNVKDAA